MFKRLLREEKGAALPLVVIVLGLFLLGFTALVVDAGSLYVERRVLVTAADAGALAGAKELADNLPDHLPDTGFTELVKNKAKSIAKKIAVSNGANEDNVLVEIKQISVKSKDNKGNLKNELRDVIEVKVKNAKQTFFARFLGDNEADVAASAIATWGYDKSISGGNILPIFAMSTLFDTAFTNKLPIPLAGDKFLTSGDIVPGDNIVAGNWGLLDLNHSLVSPNNVGIADAFSGKASSIDMVLKSIMESESGFKDGQVDDIIVRMNDAVSKYPDIPSEPERTQNIENRQKYMRGLVPIIDYDQFTTLNPISNNKLPNPLKLPILKFGVFEIRDYLPKDYEGTDRALDIEDYLHTGEKHDYTAQGYKKGTIVGVFVGEPVQVKAEILNGDQHLEIGEVKILTYQKLIK